MTRNYVLEDIDSAPEEDTIVKSEEPEIVSADDNDRLRTQFTYEDSKRLKRKVDWHVLPILIALYLIKNMDGNLVSYVKTMNSGKSTNILKQLNMTSDQYGFASTCFSVTFILFEVPSNLIVKWSTPRLHFLRIAAAWSIICGCHAAAQNCAGFLVLRALLGVAEAGLFPGMYWHLTFWYRPDEIALRMSVLGLLGQFSGIIDSFLTYGLSYIDGRGMAGWRWSYLICGLIGLVVCVWVYLAYPDFPDSPPSRRQFLSQEEGAFLVARLPPKAPRSSDANFDWPAVSKELKSPLLWAYALYGLCMNSASYGLAFWLPTIISSFGLASGPKSQLLNIPSAVVSIVAALSVAWFLDNDTRIPRPVVMIFGSLGYSLIFVGMIVCRDKGGLYALIILAYVFTNIAFLPIFPMRAQSLSGSAATGVAFAIQNAAGQIPGLYTAQFFLSKYAPRYATSYGICIAFLVASWLVVSFIWYHQYDTEKETRRIARLRRKEGRKGNVALEDLKL